MCSKTDCKTAVRDILSDTAVAGDFAGILQGLDPSLPDAATLAATALAGYATRAETLIETPDALNQGSFGTCGMAAMVRSMLQHDRGKFADLVSAVFRRTDFQGIRQAEDGLLGGRMKQHSRKASRLKANLIGGRGYELDFILSRSLGKLLKIAAPDMYEAQLLFSGEIIRNFGYKYDQATEQPILTAFTVDDPAGEYAAELRKGNLPDDLKFDLSIKQWRLQVLCGFGIDVKAARVDLANVPPDYLCKITYPAVSLLSATRTLLIKADAGQLAVAADVTTIALGFQGEGDLGLDHDGLDWLMRKVVKAASVTFTRANSPRTALTAAQAASAQFDAPKPYAYALINGAREWLAANRDASARTFDKAAGPWDTIWGREAPEAVHIVALNGKVTDEDPYVKIPVWTWANTFTVRIRKEHLHTYIYGYVHGQM